MAPPPKYLKNVYSSYPDNDEDKEVYIQAAGRTYLGDGDRHVTLLWTNGGHFDSTDETAETVVQLIQLTGGTGSYNFYSPVAEERKSYSIGGNNELFSLGLFSRVQRNRIIELAEGIRFERGSNKNGCRVWTRDLLQLMVQTGLISEEKFAEVDEGVPLVLRVAE